MACQSSDYCFKQFSIKDPHISSLSLCFETFAFVVGPFVLLAVASSFYIGKLRPPDVSLRIPYSFKLKKTSTVLTLILTLGALLNDLILFKQHVCSIMLLSYGTRIISLFVHFVFLWRLGLIHFDYKRGPAVITFFWFLTFPFYIINLERTIAELIQMPNSDVQTKTNQIINMFCIAGMVLCQLAYIVGIAQGNPRYRTVSILSRNSESTSNLLSTNCANNDAYYSVNSNDLPSAQAEGPCPVDSTWTISKLLFCWVQPLMTKGSSRLLNSESSVYQLPSNITTAKLCQNFEEKLRNITTKAELQSNTRQPKDNIPKRNLLQTLHSVFGVKYYLLGFLKFGADALGFAGPLLLNRLVTFVEKKDVSISEGFIYATALFGSTLIGSLLLIHFDFQV